MAAAAAHLACAFFDDTAEPMGEPSSLHALDACALCAKPLARDDDIFMYRGDTPFCSEECRYEQMQLDAISARLPASSSRSVSGRRQSSSYSSGAESRRGHRDAKTRCSGHEGNAAAIDDLRRNDVFIRDSILAWLAYAGYVVVSAVASGLICGDGIWTFRSSLLSLAKIKPPMCLEFTPGTRR